MAKDEVLTGGYLWGEGHRVKGNANAVMTVLNGIKNLHGHVDIDGMATAWKRGDKALRETMGSEAEVLEIGIETQAYKILRALEYEKVNVRTEETSPAGRVFQPLAKLTGNADNVRVFVETPREAIFLGSAHRPPVAPPAGPSMRALPRPDKPMQVLTMADVPTRPEPPLDLDMQAWLALCEWRDRYGHIARYQPIVDAMDALRD